MGFECLEFYDQCWTQRLIDDPGLKTHALAKKWGLHFLTPQRPPILSYPLPCYQMEASGFLEDRRSKRSQWTSASLEACSGSQVY